MNIYRTVKPKYQSQEYVYGNALFFIIKTQAWSDTFRINLSFDRNDFTINKQ